MAEKQAQINSDDNDDSDMDWDELREWIAKRDANKPKAKKKSDAYKRCKVGAYIFSTFVVSFYAGLLYQVFWCFGMNFVLAGELLAIQRKPNRDKVTNVQYYQWIPIFIAIFGAFPEQHVNFTTIYNSGLTEDKYPLLHFVFFRYHKELMILFISAFLIAVTHQALSLSGHNRTYFVNQIGYSAIVASMEANFGPRLIFASRYGRFWYFFPQFMVTFNDINALVCGKLFGRNKLIGISPNKTVEGFVGAMLLTPPITFFATYTMFTSEQKDFWICGSQEYDIGIFSNYRCQEIHQIFKVQQVFIPGGGLIGLPFIMCMPAQIYCAIFGIFSAFLGPFAGFCASGFKRAYSIKDFCDKLPGHGGYIDRYDCCIFSCVFCSVLMMQFVYREDITMDQVFNLFHTKLDHQDQRYILQFLQAQISNP